ncbi:MAG: flippase-like domain-containing protein [Candidatus Pacebacteria bacterium]|nr:flippase-like domain-containing protein [Candidatus Paceibacterota bacterium]
MARKLQKLIFPVARTVVGLILAVVLVYLTLKSTNTDLLAQLKTANPALLALAFALHGLVILLGTWRWKILLDVQNIRLRWRDLLRLTMIGFFFNLVIPGAVGGDLVKMGFISRQTPGQRTESVFSIMVDRIMGILGLFVVASIVVVFSLPFLLALGEEYRTIQVAAFTVGLGSIAGALAVLALEFHHVFVYHPRMLRLFQVLGNKLPAAVTDTIRRVMRALDIFRKSPGAMVATLVLAVGIHSVLAFDLYMVGKSLHEDHLTVADYFLTAQVANAIAAIPVTPAGVGPRDYVAKTFFEALEMNPDTIGAIPVTFTLIIIFWGLMGALVFITAPIPKPRSDDRPQSDNEER